MKGEPGYIDSSTLLAHLLREQDQPEGLMIEGSWVTSELTELECRRALDRVRLQEQLPENELAGRLSELDEMLEAVRKIPVGPAVFRRAKGSFPTVVRSLDAIHLATAELASCAFILTRDRQQAIAARAIGLKVVGGAEA